MANSKYEYVKVYERDEVLLPDTWIVVRIDGRGFHKLSTHYAFHKPNDIRALNLMNYAATAVVRNIPDLIIAYGYSDEYSFVFHESTKLFERRAAKLVSTIVSCFTAHYVFGWAEQFGGSGLDEDWLPTFDGRAVCYPKLGKLRDYLSWRQVDCHINNLYNTTFWTMVLKGGMNPKDAEEELKGSLAADKNEILFKRFGINYNNEKEIFKKGSVVFREYQLEDIQVRDAGNTERTPDVEEDREPADTEVVSKTQIEKMKRVRAKAKVVVKHVDIIREDFWQQRPWVLSGMPGRPIELEG